MNSCNIYVIAQLLKQKNWSLKVCDLYFNICINNSWAKLWGENKLIVKWLGISIGNYDFQQRPC